MSTKKVTCYMCKKGYALDNENNQCLLHNVGKCFRPLYNDGKFSCFSCESGHIFDVATKKCIGTSSNFPNCSFLTKENEVVECH